MRTRIVWLMLAAASIRTPAAETPAEEYHVKGAFLLNFARFVEWPAESFRSPGDAIGICIFGADPFTPALEVAAREVVAQGRTVGIRQIQDVQQGRQCHIVFVSLAERRRVHALLEAVRGESVLTVGESEGFIASGGVIEFRVEESKVRMEIGTDAARRAGLRISAKLLSLAQSTRK
jgi:hypothetical protein